MLVNQDSSGARTQYTMCTRNQPMNLHPAKVGLLQNQPTMTWCDTDNMGGATGHARR